MKNTYSFKTKTKRTLVSLGFGVSAILGLFTLPSAQLSNNGLPAGVTEKDFDNNARKMLRWLPSNDKDFFNWVIDLGDKNASSYFTTGKLKGKKLAEVFEANKRVIDKLMRRIRADMEFVSILLKFFQWAESGFKTLVREKGIYFARTYSKLSEKVLEALLRVESPNLPEGFLKKLVDIFTFPTTERFLSAVSRLYSVQAEILSKKADGNFSEKAYVHTPDDISTITDRVWSLNQGEKIEDSFSTKSGGIDWPKYYNFLQDAQKVGRHWGKQLATWFPVRIFYGAEKE